MPKRKARMTQAEQSAEFERVAQAMINAGELNPIEAERGLDQVVRRGKLTKKAGDGDPPPAD